MREPRHEIGPVFARARLDKVEEDVARLEYLKRTRSSTCRYRCDYEESDQVKLLELLAQVPCPVMVSGYRLAPYEALTCDVHLMGKVSWKAIRA